MKKFLSALLAVLMALSLAGCNNASQQEITNATWGGTYVPDTSSTQTDHVHSFSDATCTDPLTCFCGATEGEALGHNYEGSACLRCGESRLDDMGNNDSFDSNDIFYGDSNNGGADSGGLIGSESGTSSDSGMLSQKLIDSFPIKTSNMTVQQMRQLCVDFFRFSKTVLWTAADSAEIPINFNETTWETMTKGTPYGGLPYIGRYGCGNVYRMMDYYDEATGKLDITRALGTFPGLFGNHCSGGAYWGWARVVNSANYAFTENMAHARGFLRVGPYTYDDKHTGFNSSFRTKTICTDNGKDTMFESYALVKPADGLVQYSTAGHVVMVSAEPVVVRNADGTIDGTKSYLLVIEQTSQWINHTNDDGNECNMKGYIDKKYTFTSLYNSGYIPFTFAEFLGADPVEETQCASSLSGSSVTLNQIFSSTVSANYAISDVYVLISDNSGVVQKTMVKATAVHTMKLALKNAGNNVDVWGNPDLSRGSYTVKIQAQLGTGERITVYSGKLAN